MSQIPVSVDRELGEEALPPKSLAAPTIQRFSDASRNSVRFWEWDCSVKYPIISRFRQNSSQFDTFKRLPCNSCTPCEGQDCPNQAQLCPILGIGLFRKIPNNSPVSTQFIIIQHIPTHFVPVIDSTYADR